MLERLVVIVVADVRDAVPVPLQPARDGLSDGRFPRACATADADEDGRVFAHTWLAHWLHHID